MSITYLMDWRIMPRMSTLIYSIKTAPLWSKIKKPSKQMFWAWIAYQTIKGTLTTSLIWIPLLMAMWK